MSKFKSIAIVRKLVTGFTMTVGIVYFANSHAQVAHEDSSTGAAQEARPQIDKPATHSTGANTRESKSENPTSTDREPLPELQLIRPRVPSCWSHAQAENPQGSQNNGEPVEQEVSGSVDRRISPDPLLGTVVPRSLSETSVCEPNARQTNAVQPGSCTLTPSSQSTRASSKPGK